MTVLTGRLGLSREVPVSPMHGKGEIRYALHAVPAQSGRGMTISAELGCLDTKLSCSRVVYIMNPVAVCTNRHIWIIVSDEISSMYTSYVSFIYFYMTLSASF